MAKASKAPLTARQVFARNMRQVRRHKELSQEALGFESGLSRVYIGLVERGEQNITIDRMELVARALGVPLYDLMNPDKFQALDY